MSKVSVMKKSYAVFGLGRYGHAVAMELVNNGVEVLGVDISEELVEDARKDIPYCKCADVTDIEALRQLGIASVDVVIIAMASRLETSVMATMLCKELGVETVISKCANEMGYKILKKVGADRVVFPERDSGTRLAKNLLCSGFVDIMELTKNASMLEIDVRPAWVGKSLVELNLRQKLSMNVVAILQKNEVIVNIDPNGKLESDMRLIVIANPNKLMD